MNKSAVIAIILIVAAAAAPAAPLTLSDSDTHIVLGALSHAAEDGLDPGLYRVPADKAAIAPILLAYMRDLRTGRPGLRSLDDDVALPFADFDAGAALGEAIGQDRLGALMAGLAPPYPDYAALKSALAHYRAIAAQGGWPAIDSHSNAALLLRRLSYEDKNVLSSSLPEAVKRFQIRHGLKPDGTVGPATLVALNVTADARAATIAANMERWRWLPRTLEPDRIVINVADANLELFQSGKSVLTSRVIVGKPRSPTPIMRAEGAGVTINPAWSVPQSIAAREILPKLKRNPAYLASQDMVLLNGPPGDPQGLHVNWRVIRAGTFPYRIRQQPGPKNSLGRIKIELPNQFDVYLHDTPGKAAFNAANRDVSHGCVRVEQILPLASYALATDLGETKKISDAVDTGATSYLPLRQKLPVYFLYWTGFVEPDGAVDFRPDIYGRDQRMIAAMAVQSPRLASNPVKCARG